MREGMRVLWTSHSGHRGGAQSALSEGVDALAERGHEVHVVLPEEGDLRDQLARAASVRVVYHAWWMSHDLPVRTRLARLGVNVLRARSTLARVARKVSADVVVANTMVTPAPALAARSARLPLVWYLHEFGDLDHRLDFDWGRAPTLRAIHALSTRVMANSEAVAGYVAEWIPRRKIDVVRYAVNVDESIPRRRKNGEPLRFLLLGRRTPRKGLEEAIRALAALPRDGRPVRLDLVGPGLPAYDEWLRELIRELDVADRAFLLPFDPRPETRIAEADVLLMCSAMEAFGRVTVEAQKLGVPVIAAAAGGSMELVAHGETGLLYAPGDVAALTGSMAALRDREELRLSLGRRAREESRRTFSSQRYGSELESVLRRASGRS
ncbi:MAG: glycosyltransferase family 4 protein [Gemmatimonadetes bacterium]|nr:glycosyltransferase family 4 protein [Gemmatimonadota bacterium]